MLGLVCSLSLQSYELNKPLCVSVVLESGIYRIYVCECGVNVVSMCFMCMCVSVVCIGMYICVYVYACVVYIYVCESVCICA